MGAAGGSTFSVAVCVTEHVLCMCVCVCTHQAGLQSLGRRGLGMEQLEKVTALNIT